MQRNSKKIKNLEGRRGAFKNTTIALVVSEYHFDITRPIEEASRKTLLKGGLDAKNIVTFFVPGAFEIPIICREIAELKKYNGVVAIGCVIRGDTDHYVYISNEATRGVMDVMLKYGLPISNAILTVNNLKQAKIRSNGALNKGIEAAEALLKVLALTRKVR